jgi:lysyl-tRNA synthetase class I
MFLDEKGEKISKSKGNGLSLDQWLTYGTEESLAFYAYREPKSAKQLHMGVIPRAVDEYFQFRGNYPAQPIEQKLGNPVHHIITAERCPTGVPPVTFGLLLNLVGVMGPMRPRRRSGPIFQLCARCDTRDAARTGEPHPSRLPITATSSPHAAAAQARGDGARGA